MGGDFIERRLSEVVGSGLGAVSGLLRVRFPDPPAEAGVPITEHWALHEIMPLALDLSGRPAKGLGCCCLDSGIE